MTTPSILQQRPNNNLIDKYNTTEDIYNYAKLNKWNKKRFL